MESLFVCQVCGHIEFEAAPVQCPVCVSPKEKYENKPDVIMPAEKEGKEKHVPVITVTEACGLIPDACRDVHIQVGSTPHPMQEDHWIAWIDVYINKKYASRYMLSPQSLQAAVGLHLKKEAGGTISAIELCNKHGYWMAEADL